MTLSTTAPTAQPAAIIVPPAPAGTAGFTKTTGSGLYVPDSYDPATRVAPLASHQLVIPAADTRLDAATMGTQARAGCQEIADRDGAAVADILLGSQFPVIDSIAAQERHDAIIAAFLAGRVPAA